MQPAALLPAVLALPRLHAFPKGVWRHAGFGSRAALEANFFQDNKWVVGFLAQELWNLLEVTQGVYDFTFLDDVVARSETDKKPCIIVPKTGGGSTSAIPTWISGAPYNRPVHWQNDSVQSNLCPWDAVVAREWLRTSAVLAVRYDRNPWVAGIYLSGVPAQYPEMDMPDASKFKDKPGDNILG